MPWKNSWFQLAALVAVISGGLLIYDFGPTAYSSLMAAKSAPAVTNPLTIPPASLPPQPVATDNAEAAGYRIKASAGDVESARKLGLLYFLGKGVPKDYTEALKWLQAAAEKGDSDAQDKMGIMYDDGLGVALDDRQGLAWFKEAADQGNAQAQADLGAAYENGFGVKPDYNLAFQWFQKSADQGNSLGQVSIGGMYEKGLGVTQDYNKALSWYLKASAQNNPYADNAIANMYLNGLGVEKSYDQALKYYQIAADKDNEEAEEAIGSMYEKGVGVTKDIPTALEWYKKAAAQGDFNAQRIVKQLESPPSASPPATPVQPASAPTPPTPSPAAPQPIAPPATPTPAAVGPVAGQEWYNSLGMKFVPAGTDGVLFGTWDVRVQDFQAYVQATGYQMPGGIYVMKVKANANGSRSLVWELDPNASWQQPGFEQGPTHPVVGVCWNDAITFCEWLTKKERGEGKLGSHQMYRLPTDAEWSTAVGDGKYPWGDVWPPPDEAGNYADQAFASSLPGTGWHGFLLENDGFPRPSPVGSFRPNAYGLYDMGGNVWQWCMDWYLVSMNSDEIRQKIPALNNDGGGTTYKVLRGASWFSFDPVRLLSSCRFFDVPGGRYDFYGFRVVVVVSP